MTKMHIHLDTGKLPDGVILDVYLIPNESEWKQGYANGYVRVGKTHEWYRRILESEAISFDEYGVFSSPLEAMYDVSIHGGVTYAAIDKASESAVIGFDTRHLGDNPVGHDINFCTKEVRKLADAAISAYICEQTR
jgi:hypothetical protein